MPLKGLDSMYRTLFSKAQPIHLSFSFAGWSCQWLHQQRGSGWKKIQRWWRTQSRDTYTDCSPSLADPLSARIRSNLRNNTQQHEPSSE